MAETIKTTDEVLAELTPKLTNAPGTSALIRLVVDVFGLSLQRSVKGIKMGLEAAQVLPVTVSVAKNDQARTPSKATAQNDLEKFFASTPGRLVQDFDLWIRATEKDVLSAIAANKGRLQERYGCDITVLREDGGRVLSFDFQSKSFDRSVSFKVAI